MFVSREPDEAMRRAFIISRHACAILAVVALSMPSRTLPCCRCCKPDTGADKPAAAKSDSCCLGKSKAASGHDATTKTDHKQSSESPRGCSDNCTSACSWGKPTTPVSVEPGAEFLALTPIGLISAQPGQQPRPPTLDGLLRPPRA